MFKKVLIANRGAIATRIIRTLKAMDVASISIYHEDDAESLHVQTASESYSLGFGTVQDTYLNIEKIIAIAKQSGAEAIHPGYGFLSENTEFVAKLDKAGIAFIGPTSDQIEVFGLKHMARDCAEKANVPLVPGSGILTSVDHAIEEANRIGFPLMLKSTAGGGGIGMQVCRDSAELEHAWDKVRHLGQNYFSNNEVFLEKFIERARHIEVQIFGDGKGTAVSFGERDCSAQRRNQKVIEECPAPRLSDTKRTELHKVAETLMASVNYRNAGTVEFIYDVNTDEFYFLEVNTRLQVEHGVTEEVWGIDLVELMIQVASGTKVALEEIKAQLKPEGHAVQARVYAEDTLLDHRPSSGLLSKVGWHYERGVRIDTWVESGIEVSPLFDPMIAKVISHSSTREKSLSKLTEALEKSELYGFETNSDYLIALINSPICREAKLLTNSLADFQHSSHLLRVLKPGTMTTLQDVPGRSGYWHVGIPRSGPMDSLAFRLGNAMLGNAEDAVGIEITLNGPSLEFCADAHFVLTGAEIEAELDGQVVNNYQCVHAQAGQILKLGKVRKGARSYLMILGGIACPEYLGSRSTFTLGQFGGHSGRALRSGDVLKLNASDSSSIKKAQLSIDEQPKVDHTVKIRVLYGPHGAPDFFTQNDIDEFFKHEWEVHYNSSRTGVRLIGPKPEWARETGGEAGLHPSNIHDNAYAFGSIDFTGDMPVILGPDGPSLGGFVCPATVITADLWKLGQLTAGSKIQFIPVDIETAVKAESNQLSALKAIEVDSEDLQAKPLTSPILVKQSFQGEDFAVRLAGDHFVLIELGPTEINIERRFRVHALMLWLEEHSLPGMLELTPGIRSLQIHYDSQKISLQTLLQHIDTAKESLESEQQVSLPSRIVKIPLSWDDSACREAIEKYTQTVRPGAPWCPSNIDFIRRVNGLKSVEAVKDLVFSARYLVMGLGDVYLGAPVATPVDPRQRLVTTKYNPARTWTAENSVGIGGAYLCVYGMEGPGGYQFVGRTLQMWNRYRSTAEFSQPWLLRFFDQIQFYPVSEDELLDIRKKFPLGQYPIEIEECEFNMQAHNAFLDTHASEISAFRERRLSAFNEELERWRETGQLSFEADSTDVNSDDEGVIPEDLTSVDSPVSGTVWKLVKNVGDSVRAGETIAILESMKMELELTSEADGTIERIPVSQGQSIQTGQSLIWIKESL
jgi:urea carboxylase